MRKSRFTISSWLIVAALSAAPIYAQTPPPPPDSPPQTIDLATAKKMVAAAEAAAVAMKQKVAICVMDSNGDVVFFERMDGVSHIPVATAQGKARAALIFGIPTGEIADAASGKKPITATILTVPVGTGGEVTLNFRGGLPIRKDGKLIGAIGIGGSASVNDEKFSQAGIDAIAAK